MGDEIKRCGLEGAVLRDGVCYLGDAPVVETATDLKQKIAENSADGEDTLVFFTANWCPGCKIIKPFVKAGSDEVKSSARMVVCDESGSRDDPCGSMGGAFIPFFKNFDGAGNENEVGWSQIFNYYLAGHQIGLRHSIDSPASGDISRFGAGIVANIQTPLMARGIGTQLAATAHFDGRDFESADIEAKIYSPTVGELVFLSPVRFLGLYAGTGVQWNDGGEAGMKNSVGAEIFRSSLMGWLLSAEMSIYEFDPVTGSKRWLPSVSLTVGHSL